MKIRYKFVGKKSRKIYLESHNKSEGMRLLSEKYPSIDYDSENFNQGKMREPVFPEPLIIKRSR